MMQFRWDRPIAVAGAFALAVLVAGAAGRARAQDEPESNNTLQNLENKIWGGFVRGLGLRDPNAPDIDYRERSPLVIPPTRDLPPPQAKATPRDPAWPADPDVARAKKAADAKRKRGNSNAATAIEGRGAPVSPDELNAGVPRRSADTGKSNAPAPGTDPDGRQMAPSEMGYFGGLFSLRAWGFSGYQDETGTFTNEPPRTALTEPPPGYQTPSAAQPYGVTRRIERSKTEQFDPAGRY